MAAENAVTRVSIIIPIGERHLDDEFRAFRTVAGEALIQRTLRSFAPFSAAIDKVYVLCSQADEKRFDVARRLGDMPMEIPVETIGLDAETAGPAETIARGVLQRGIHGPVIVCDVDHRLDLQPLFEAIADDAARACHVCVWPLRGESLKRWSVACVTERGLIREVAERRLPPSAGTFVGVIGCYHFAEIGSVADLCLERGLALFSDLFNLYASESREVGAVGLQTAEFFGDSERIMDIEAKQRFCGTVFCDIDGTILSHEDEPDYDSPATVLPGSREKLLKWMSEGYFVMLCTARASVDEAALTTALRRLDVPFHKIVTGLPSGPRVVINDRKPSAMFTAQALSLEIARNQGITTLELPSHRQTTVLRRFAGGSFAETLLIEDESRTFIRKHVSKHTDPMLGYARLKSQFRTMSRFSHICPGITPELYGERDNSHEYFYDMEYLQSYETLDRCSPRRAALALDGLLERFADSIYCHRSRSKSLATNWFAQHLESKIHTKVRELSAHPRLRPLLVGEGVEIDGVPYPSLQRLIAAVGSEKVFAPRFMSVVHGDMTFQNIMVGVDDDVKVIDLESTDRLEAVELDLGKNLQSIYSQYDTWSACGTALCDAASETRLSLNFRPRQPDAAMLHAVRTRWSDIMECSPDLVDLKGGLYLGLHLLRMVPFRLRISEDQALYALATSAQWLSRSLELARDGRCEDVPFLPATIPSHTYRNANAP